MAKRKSETFLVQSTQTFTMLCQAFESLWPKRSELKRQKTNPGEAEWATGWIEMGKVKATVFMNNKLIDQGATPAETERVRTKGGKTDLYELIISGVAVEETDAIFETFYIKVDAKPANGYYVWEDMIKKVPRKT